MLVLLILGGLENVFTKKKIIHYLVPFSNLIGSAFSAYGKSVVFVDLF